MSRLMVESPGRTQAALDAACRNTGRRITANPAGMCPVDAALNFLNMSLAQSCGKCVPCRVGLKQMSDLLERILDGDGSAEMLGCIEETARVIADTSDCAIGVNAGQALLQALSGFRTDFEAHVRGGRCAGRTQAHAVPCVSLCPAHVDVPGYIALIKAGRNGDAVRLIRKDNPFPSACGYICEHPCESHCRRIMIDSALNIRGLKRYAVDHAARADTQQPKPAPATGKTVAVVGGGPGGLTAAYYLALMGHAVTVYEKRHNLGGMMRYGIPSYRFPREVMDAEIDSILSLGIKVHRDFAIGTDLSFEALRKQYDAVYFAIGAHTDKKIGIPGEESHGVASAVEFLRAIGDGDLPDLTGRKVVVVGGGNVAMDVTRSAVRLGAEKVTCVYRRRREDMTALPEEADGAAAEGAELLMLQAPARIEADAEGNAAALWTKPQIIGKADRSGRPSPQPADLPEQRIPADLILVAIGQAVDMTGLKDCGIPLERWGTLCAGADTAVPGMDGVFAGGDCVSGPSTVIKAIAAGKAAAANIDAYLGFCHEIGTDVKIPEAGFIDMNARGRVDLPEREAGERKRDFVCMENGMTAQEAGCEAGRCLRCDCYGFGSFRRGRTYTW